MSLKPSLVIYDFGKVIVNFDVERQFEYWQSICGVDADHLRARYKINNNYLAYERGEIDDHTFYADTCRRMDMEIDFNDFVAGWNAIFMDRKDDVIDCIARLRGKVRQVVLSNTNALHASKFRSRFEKELTLVDDVYASNEIGARKPDADCFHKVLALENATASQSVFFDDLAENVNASQQLGMRAFQVRDDGDVRAGLRAVGFEGL